MTRVLGKWPKMFLYNKAAACQWLNNLNNLWLFIFTFVLFIYLKMNLQLKLQFSNRTGHTPSAQ